MEILTACVLLISTFSGSKEKVIKNKNVFIYLKAAGVNVSFQNCLENMTYVSPQRVLKILSYSFHTIKTNSDASMVCCEFTD